jgi:hypothetical protein
VNIKALCGSAFVLNLMVAHGFSTNPDRRLASILDGQLWMRALRLYRVSGYLGSPKLGSSFRIESGEEAASS